MTDAFDFTRRRKQGAVGETKIFIDRAGSHSMMDSNVFAFALGSWQAAARRVTAAGKGRTSGELLTCFCICLNSRRLSSTLCSTSLPRNGTISLTIAGHALSVSSAES